MHGRRADAYAHVERGGDDSEVYAVSAGAQFSLRGPEMLAETAGVDLVEGRRADHATAAPAIAAPDRAWVALCRKAENP